MKTPLLHALQHPVCVDGIGLHSGHPVRATLTPAPPGDGIAFVRVDLPGCPMVRARAELAEAALNQTVLSRDGVRVETPEHLLAALMGLGVFDARIELTSPEVPILDGSAAPWVEALWRSGLAPCEGSVPLLRPPRPVRLEADGGAMELCPGDGLTVICTIEHHHPRIGQLQRTYRHDPATFGGEIAPARTFGFLDDVLALRKRGLIRGGSLENAVVFDDTGVRNPEGLRFPDEPVRHKILDLLGDLALLGLLIQGTLTARNTSHRLHRRFLHLLQEGLDRAGPP